MSINFKKPALAAISAFGVLAVAPFACCDEKGKIDPFHMQIVGKYFDSAQDIANLEMVNRKFKCISKKYKFNPVPYNKFVFRGIETCQVYPEEFGRIVKFEEDKNIKQIIYLEGSFTAYLLRKVLADNGALDWEYEIVFNDLKNAIYGFKAHFYNQGKIITFCFNPLKMLKMFNYGNQVMIDNLLSDFSAFVDYCEIDPRVKYEELSKTLESFVLPDDVVNLEAGTFTNLKNLKKLYISDFVESVSNYAFEGCNNLTEIHYKGKVYRNPKDFTIAFKVGQYSNGENFENIKISDSVSEIKKYAFEMCTPLKSVVIPNSVKKIDTGVFWYCPNLSSVEIPDSVSEIGTRVFEGCSALKNVKLPSNIEEIKDSTFFDCRSLTDVFMPDCVKKIGSSAFKSCINLKNIKFSNSLEIIDISAFEDCASLTEVIIPDSVKVIRQGAFAGCVNLKKVKIPDCLEKFDVNVFDECPSLNHIEYKNKVYKSIEDFLTAFSVGPYAGYENFEDIEISSSVDTIKNFAFGNCKSLKSVKIPNTVKNISGDAFLNCESLTSVSIPDSVTTIGPQAFGRCLNLTEINVPDSVEKMGSAVFYSCEKLSSVKLPSSIKVIGTSFFAACDKLKNIKIPEGVKEIGNYAFFKCFSLEEIVIPKSVSRIGIRLFDTCTSLKKVQILGSIEEISSGMFSNCKLLEDIQIPDSVTVIGEKAFKNCKSLKEIKLPKNLKIICDYAFDSCVSLEKIVVPDDTVAIGYRVFENCTNLKTISYRGKDYSSAEDFINDFIFQTEEEQSNLN